LHFILFWLLIFKKTDNFFVYRAYDRAAVMFRGVDADINFNLSDYEEDLKQVKTLMTMINFCLHINFCVNLFIKFKI